MIYLISRLNIFICGNIELEQLAEQIDSLIPDNTIITGKPDQFTSELAHMSSAMPDLDFCIIALDWNRILPNFNDFGFSDSIEKECSLFVHECNTLNYIFKLFRSKNNARILIFSPISLPYISTGFISRFLNNSAFHFYTKCQEIFNNLCNNINDLYPVDLDLIIKRTGADNAINTESDCLENQPFTLRYIRNIAEHTVAVISQFCKPIIKCIVMDLDNTLWGGIIGESGLDLIELDDHGPGLAYKKFQREIIKLYKQGCILAICSKNNTCDALEVMEMHPHMLIKPEKISCFRINWENKPNNILSMADELGISTESMLFIDDSAFEREMVRNTIKDIEILEIPDSPYQYSETLAKYTRIWPLQLTKEDVDKSKQYASNRMRQTDQKLSENIQSFLFSSKISIKISIANKETLPRAIQLFNKTNQFNLSTIRYSLSEIYKILEQPDNTLFLMTMTDKYGEYGIIGAALILKNHINCFILSCRAFGKYAEHAFACVIINKLFEKGYSEIFGLFRPTVKNSMTKDFYKSLNFILHDKTGNEELWKLSINGQISKIPEWITIIQEN
jgi:FkbH-like protein